MHREIARGSATVALFVLIAGVLRGALEVLIAWTYGVSEKVDAYYFVVTIVTWPISIWFSALTVVLVPLFSRARHESMAGLNRFRAELLGATITLSAMLAAACFALLAYLFRTPLSGLSETARQSALEVTAVSLLLIPLGLLAGLLSVWLIAEKRHVNTLLEGVPATVVIACLLAVPNPTLGVLVWSTVGGFAVRLLLLHGLLGWRDRVEKPAFKLRSPRWLEFRKSFGMMMLGQSLIATTLVVDQFFAAHLGEGAVAAFNYANRSLALVLLLGATSIQRASLPVFSSARVTGDVTLPGVVRRWVKVMFFLGLLAMAIGWHLTPAAVSLLFERGAFLAADTAQVSHVVRFGLLQFPFYFSGLVLVSSFASSGRHGAIAIAGAVGFATKCAANVALVGPLGLAGIMVGSAFMYAATLSFLLWAAAKTR